MIIGLDKERKAEILMEKRKLFLWIIAGIPLFILAIPQVALAYLEPGTMSYFLQILIAAFCGMLYAVRVFWNKIKESMRNLYSEWKSWGRRDPRLGKDEAKGIIIAAGRGSRLGPLTEDIPKCLLKINGKTLLEKQLEVFNQNQIKAISVIKGYKQEKINLPGITYFMNSNYEKNNILHSLMCAESVMNGAFIATYADIIFSSDIMARLNKVQVDMALVVDTDWQENYTDRSHHPENEAEKVIFDDRGLVVEIGKTLTQSYRERNHGEFIGMMRCSNRGAEIFRKHFHQARADFKGKAFIQAKDFEKAYLTDFIQYMVNQGERVECLLIQGGWHEIDTLEDMQRIEAMSVGGRLRIGV